MESVFEKITADDFLYEGGKNCKAALLYYLIIDRELYYDSLELFLKMLELDYFVLLSVIIS